jgi:amino acid adenylation domain-containing protein
MVIRAVTTETGEAAISLDLLPFTRADIEQTVPLRFEQAVRCFPGLVALVGDGQRWTYIDLNRRVNQIAHAIKASTEPGIGCVAFLLNHSPEMVIAALAVLKAAKVYLAIHPGTPVTAQREIVRDAAPELMLTTAKFESRAREITSGACAILRLDDIDERYSDAAPQVMCKPCDPSTIFYTSGTTGQPKGVVKSHRAVLHRVWLSAQHDAIVPGDRQSLLTYCSFAASESDMFGALLNGATLCVFDIASKGLTSFSAWVDEEEITVLHPPVLLFRRFLSTLEGENLFPSVRLVALAGDRVLPSDVEEWKRHFSKSCSLTHRFSMTETALLTVSRVDHETVPEPGTVSAGRPVADKCLMLIDEAGEAVAAGGVGELVVKSSYIAEGYWRQPEETAAVFKPDPQVPGQRIYRTGDLGRFSHDGSFEFLGRRDHQVKIRGHRVDTREVDFAILQLEEVSEAATITRNENDEPQLVAFVVFKQGFQLDSSALRGRLREYLPDWKVPARFQSLPSLPMTLTGKVDKQRLEKAVRDPLTIESNCAETRLTIEQELAEIWKTTLRLDAVGYDDSFFDLGGNSISAMIASNRIEQRYGIRLLPSEVLQNGTIGQLAELIRSRTRTVDHSSLDGNSGSCSNSGTGETRTQQQLLVENVSDGYIELLNAFSVDYIFVNPGSGTAPILESVAKFSAEGRRTPELVLCLHESVTMAAAHGYFMVSGKPQIVLVHVDVGTQNIGANLHNAQRGRAGVVVCAGRTPYTVDANLPGGRNRYIHWIQEQFSQASSVQGYVKWHYELTCRENLGVAVQRAFQVAGTEPAGPVYLTLPREVLMQKTEALVIEPGRAPTISTPAADSGSLSRAAQWLIEADSPLILVAYAGRNPKAVASLVRLAEVLAAPVVESRHRINFPSSHPLHLGFSAARYLQQADCVLILDHDVPWVPAQGRPTPDCRVIHLDIDPLKRDIPIWGFPVDLAIQADSSQAVAALAEEIERRLSPSDRARIETRRHSVTLEHQAQRALWRQRALDLAARQPIAPEWAAFCVNEIVDEETVVVSEAVTNNPILWSYLQLDTPGTYYQSLGSGLGWGLGAALGAKLAAPSKTVICTIGDGSWVFSSPIAVYWAAQQHASPFLTVIFNNQEYAATTEAILTTAPKGYARKTGTYPVCDLPKPPLYSKLAEAMGLWARTVDEPTRLQSALREALAEVRRGRSALVDICVSSSRPPADG